MRAGRTTLPQLYGEMAEGLQVLGKVLELSEHRTLATETLILALLEQLPTRTPTDLARLTGLSRGRITHLVNALVERGFVVKRPDHQDRRRTLVSLTADGREAAHAALARVETLEGQLTRELGPAGFDMLVQQLGALRRLSGE